MSRSEYQTQLNKLARWWQTHLAAAGQPARELLLSDLSDELLKLAMHHYQQAGNQAPTVNKLYRHVKAIWNLAWARDLVPRQCRTKPYRELRREPRAWLPEEVEQIVRAAFLMPGQVGPVAANVWWPALVLVSLNFGTRIGSTMSLRTADLDLERGEVLIRAEHQKHRADQPFDLLPSTRAALQRLAPQERNLSRVFGDWPYDTDGGWRTLRRHLRRLLVLSGLFESADQVTRYDLTHRWRKTVATEITLRVGMAAAQEYLGHSSQSVTKLYVDRRRANRPRAADVLSDPLPPHDQLRLFNEAG